MREHFAGITEAIRTCGVRMAKAPDAQVTFFARLQPEADSDAGVPAKPGVPRKHRFLMIAEAAAFEAGEHCGLLYHGDTVFTVLRLEPVRFGERISHWEGTVKLKSGGDSHD